MVHERLDLVETILHPGALNIREQIGEDVHEMIEQLEKQTERLKELKEKKEADPSTYQAFLHEPFS